MNKTIEEALESIARNNLLFETLTTQNTPDDFNEVAVWCVKKALEEAYQKGQQDGQQQKRA